MRVKSTMLRMLSGTLLIIAGCNASDNTPPPTNMNPQPVITPSPSPQPGPVDVDGPPAPSPTPAPIANYSGTFNITSPLDFTQNGVLPGIVGPVLGSLGELHDHPGAALYNILENSNIPTLSNLLMQVPAALQAGLEGLLDNLITTNVYNTYPIVDQITAVISGITQLASKIDVQESVTVHVPVGTTVAVDQELTGINFTLFGMSHVAPLPSPTVLHSTGTLTPHNDAPVADADISFTGGTVNLPIGALILDAAGPLLFSNFGSATTLTGVLQELVPCASFGQSLSNATGGTLDVSIGTDLCNGALAVVGDAVTAQIDSLTLNNVVISPATATLLDVSIQAPHVD